MRKIVTFILLISLFLAACTDGESNESAESTAESNSEEEAVEIETVKEDDEEETVEENEADMTEEVEEQEMDQEPKYEISEDATVLPLEDGINEQVVLLTIDDAPSTYTMEMANTLKSLDAGAIFFVNGHFLDTPEEEEMLKELHEMGFIIGNHTYNHPLLNGIPEEEQREEIVSLSDRVEEIIGERPKFFRAPNGVNTEYSEKIVEEEEMVLMNWTYGYDYFEPYMNAEKLAEAMITGEGPEVDVPYSLLKPGANLLMHDREWTNEALEDIVTGLRDQGYEIVDPHTIQVMGD